MPMNIPPIPATTVQNITVGKVGIFIKDKPITKPKKAAPKPERTQTLNVMARFSFLLSLVPNLMPPYLYIINNTSAEFAKNPLILTKISMINNIIIYDNILVKNLQQMYYSIQTMVIILMMVVLRKPIC